MVCNNVCGIPLRRVSGRQGQPVALDVMFYRNGVASDPYAFRFIDIYKGCVKDENLYTQFVIPDLGTTGYPAPIEQLVDPSGVPICGSYRLLFDVPKSYPQDIYFDVWRFVADPPGSGDDITNPDLLQSQANRFWVSPDGWFLDDGLETVRFTFEPMDQKFRKPEKRILEVSIIPQPLYDFNCNQVMPLIPQLCPAIKIETENCELLVDWEPCAIGLRMGAYKDSPFTVQFLLDTSRFLVGTYRYQIMIQLPNGQTRISEKMIFTVC